jgi:hypothetical protein
LSNGIKLGIADFADSPIFPSDLNADDRTSAFESLSNGIKLGIADSPILPSVLQATHLTPFPESLSNGIKLDIAAFADLPMRPRACLQLLDQLINCWIN